MKWSYLRRMPLWTLMFAACGLLLSCNKPALDSTAAKVPGTTKTISFGRRQIDQLLADRPDMVGVLADDDPIVVWIADSMNGGRIGRRVYWNADSPRTGGAAEHALPYGVNPPFICITGGAEVSPIDKWASLVYELFNLE